MKIKTANRIKILIAARRDLINYIAGIGAISRTSILPSFAM
jgi:hypothetical protein